MMGKSKESSLDSRLQLSSVLITLTYNAGLQQEVTC